MGPVVPEARHVAGRYLLSVLQAETKQPSGQSSPCAIPGAWGLEYLLSALRLGATPPPRPAHPAQPGSLGSRPGKSEKCFFTTLDFGFREQSHLGELSESHFQNN